MLLLKKNIQKKNYLFACWFFNKNIINFLFKILGVGVKKAIIGSGFDIVIEVISKMIYPIIFF